MSKSLCMVAYTTYATDARVVRAAEAAAAEGYTVDVVTPRKEGEPRSAVIQGVRLHRLGGATYSGSNRIRYLLSYLLFFFRCFLFISTRHLRRRYRIVHVHNMPDGLVFAAATAKVLGARVILDIHDPMPEMAVSKFGGSRRSWLYRLLLLQERMSASFADKVMTVHEPLKRDILVKDGIDGDRIVVVANFPDGDVFRVAEPFRPQIPLRMIYHGTIAARFGFEETLRAVRSVRGRDKLFVKIIGEGDFQDPLKRLIRRLGLEGIVDFENRFRPLRELPGLLGQFHLGFVPYERSAATDYMLPVKLLELLAMGIPSITVANIPIRFYLNKDMYFAYNPGDMRSLTDLIERVLAKPPLVAEKREAILKVRERYLWKGEARKYLDLLQKLSP